ncbi:hypothetical protein F8388_018389 [Cannabis sativa]|uniref:Uncharacterized protein n=1 Tax=Cannabis sativa TaxID=3483 RepID=A0A7J6HGW2_CANSA|nr:hypothetical protein F8388_018389 [Cannabis sativa]
MDSDVGHTNKEMGSLQSPHIFEAGQSSIGLEKIGPNSPLNHSRGEAFGGVFDSQLTKSIAGNDKGGATTDGGAAPVEGDTMVEMVDTGRFIMGYGKEVQGDGHHGKETRKRVSIKNKARAKAKMGGSQVACILSEKKKMEAGAVGLPEVGVLDGNEGNRGLQGPWLCIGDFNEIVSLSEKVGGRDRLPGVMDGFKEVLDDCRFIDSVLRNMS